MPCNAATANGENWIVNNCVSVAFKCLFVLYHTKAYSEIAVIAVMNMFKHGHEKSCSPWSEAVR